MEGSFTVLVDDEGQSIETATYVRLSKFATKLWFPKGLDKAPAPIKVVANICNRRTFALPAALIAYQKATGTEDLFEVPVIVKEYQSAESQLIERLKENVLAGRSSYTASDLLGITCKLIRDLAATPSRVKTILDQKHGTAMKLHNWASIANKFPKLNLVARAQLDQPTDAKGTKVAKPKYDREGWYPFSAIGHQVSRTLLGNCEKDDSCDSFVVEHVFGGKEPGQCNRAATEEEIEVYLKALMSGAERAAGVLDKGQITTLRDSASNADVRSLLQSVLNGDAQGVTQAQDAMNGHLSEVEKLTEENKALKAEIKDLKKQLAATTKAVKA